MSSLKDKVIIITGASSGIGADLAEHLAPFHPRLVLTGRNQEGLEKTNNNCQKGGLSIDKILTVICDINKDEDLKMLVDKTIQKFGSIYGLVNNAAVAKAPNNIEDFDMDDFDDVFRTNVRAQFHLSKLCIPHLRETKGCIVNISSILGKVVMKRAAPYSMAKAALDQFTHVLAAETGSDGIRVNTVSPGPVATGMTDKFDVPTEVREAMMKGLIAKTPLGRIANAVDVSKAVKFLLSDEAGFITGEIINVDGGCSNPSLI